MEKSRRDVIHLFLETGGNMKKRKQLKELTIKHNFLFGAVMYDENNCKGFLEMVLQIPIARVEVSKEKSILYHPVYKGVRLDVYAKDENGTHYDIEMQALKKTAIEKRSRYYHSQMDMQFLLSGEDYDRLPNSYVIFVCDFDPFGKKKYCYTFENLCLEDKNLHLGDGGKTIFLSTKGENDIEVSESLVKFLKFVNADLPDSEADFQDEFVAKLQKSIQHIKESREMEENYMLFEELLKEEREEARAEGRAEGRTEGRTEVQMEAAQTMQNTIFAVLETKGNISEVLREKIQSEKELDVLGQWMQSAALAESVDQFLEKM